MKNYITHLLCLAILFTFCISLCSCTSYKCKYCGDSISKSINEECNQACFSCRLDHPICTVCKIEQKSTLEMVGSTGKCRQCTNCKECGTKGTYVGSLCKPCYDEQPGCKKCGKKPIYSAGYCLTHAPAYNPSSSSSKCTICGDSNVFASGYCKDCFNDFADWMDKEDAKKEKNK